MQIIAHLRSDFPTKFGLPRQSGLTQGLKARIVFAPEYRDAQALRGIEDYSHLWLIWGFHLIQKEGWSPTVRPPRLGGNVRMGVFATRSPYRPNPIGLSCVKLEQLVVTQNEGTVLEVSGADMVDGTPIYDIKPYLPFADAYPEASAGFAAEHKDDHLEVEIPRNLMDLIPEKHQTPLLEILSQDPRPAYQDDPERIYGFSYANMEIRFTVVGDRLTVTEILR